MKYILSWGGGVNSTAIIAMIKLGMLPELTPENTHIVFADTGAEMPYTYEHTTRCLGFMKGWKWVCLRPNDERWKQFYSKRCDVSLPEYCIRHTVMPSRVNRWCTMEYKSKPIKLYRESLGEPTTLILGIASDELKRAKFLGSNHTYYPLIDKDINREKCIQLTEQAGIPPARKSGCYFCPFQSKGQWLELFHKYPDEFNEVEMLENLAREKYQGKSYYFCRDLPIRKQIEKWLKKEKSKCDQKEMFGLDRHCLCEI